MYLKVYVNHTYERGPSYDSYQPSVKYIAFSSSYLFQAEHSMTGRAYIGEVLTQVWLKSISK